MTNVKASISYVNPIIDDTTNEIIGYKIKAKSYEKVIDADGLAQLTKNLKLVCSEEKFNTYESDTEAGSLFVIVKVGKAYTPNVAFNPVSPFPALPSFKLFQGVESVKNRYEPSMKRTFKAIDLITKDVEMAQHRAKKAGVQEAVMAELSEEEQTVIAKFNALKKAVDLGLRLGWTCTGGLCGSGETAMATPTEMEMPTEQEVTLRGKLFFLRAAIETAKRQIRVDAELLARQAVFLIAAAPSFLSSWTRIAERSAWSAAALAPDRDPENQGPRAVNRSWRRDQASSR